MRGLDRIFGVWRRSHGERATLFPFLFLIGALLGASVCEGAGARTATDTGFLDASHAEGIDPSGSKDSTDGLERALQSARDSDRTLFLPAGIYLISRPLTLLVTSPGDCGSHKGVGVVTLVGPSNGARALLKLADRSPEFQNASAPVAMLEIKRVVGERERANCLFGSIVRSIDFDLGADNPGAVGLRFNAAQDSWIEDVRIFARDGFAGVSAVPGVAGNVGIEVVGGRFGLHLDRGSLGSALIGLRLKDQREAAIYLNVLRGGALTGVSIEKERGPAIVLAGGHPEAGHLVLTDGQIELREGGAVVDNRAGRFVSLENVYVRGADALMDTHAGGHVKLLRAEWQHVESFAFTPESIDGLPGWNVIDGRRTREEIATIRPSAEPPSTLLTQHGWGETIEFSSPGVIFADDHGARPGDDQDDSVALQAALDSHERAFVYLRAGAYLLSKPLVLGAHDRLMGVPGLRSVLRSSKDWHPERPTWLIETEDAPSGTAVLMDLALDTPDPSPFGGVHWRVGRESVVRRVRSKLFPARTETEHQNFRISGSGGGKWFGLTDHANIKAGTEAHPLNRKVLVVGTREPLRFYGLNLERGGGKRRLPQFPFLELVDAHDVRVYATKCESDGTSIALRDVQEVQISPWISNNHEHPGTAIELSGHNRSVRLRCVMWRGSDDPLVRDAAGGDAVRRTEFLGVFQR